MQEYRHVLPKVRKKYRLSFRWRPYKNRPMTMWTLNNNSQLREATVLSAQISLFFRNRRLLKRQFHMKTTSLYLAIVKIRITVNPWATSNRGRTIVRISVRAAVLNYKKAHQRTLGPLLTLSTLASSSNTSKRLIKSSLKAACLYQIRVPLSEFPWRRKY